MQITLIATNYCNIKYCFWHNYFISTHRNYL